MSGLQRYTSEESRTTPASLEAMARKLDEIDDNVKTAVTTATEARDFARKSSEYASQLVRAQSLPTSVKIAAIVGGSALGGGLVTAIIQYVVHLA